MLTLHNLRTKIKKKPRKRVGRGPSSGRGGYSGRGIKGQKARSGGNLRPGFEGGRMPLIRQIPKLRGFKSIHAKAQIVNLEDIEKKFSAGETVNPKTLFEKGLIENHRLPVKILGTGKLSKNIEFQNLLFSASARTAVERAGQG